MYEKILFAIKCTKTCNERFELHRIYNVYAKIKSDYIVIYFDKDVDLGNRKFYIAVNNNDELKDKIDYIYKNWYEDCRWRDYDWELIKTHSLLSVELL